MSGARLAGNCLIDTGACDGILRTPTGERKAEGVSRRLSGRVLVCAVAGIINTTQSFKPTPTKILSVSLPASVLAVSW
jgi:hypothetical protein